jgi:hypothetical protein
MRENDMFEVNTENLPRMCEKWRFGLHEGILA